MAVSARAIQSLVVTVAAWNNGLVYPNGFSPAVLGPYSTLSMVSNAEVVR